MVRVYVTRILRQLVDLPTRPDHGKGPI
jgi:hypothetical protein